MALKTQAEKDWLKSVKAGNYCSGAGKTPKSGKSTAYVKGICRGCGRELRTNGWGYINKHGWGKNVVSADSDTFVTNLVEAQRKPKKEKGPELGKNPCAECKNKALKNDYLCPTHRAKLTPSLAA